MPLTSKQQLRMPMRMKPQLYLRYLDRLAAAVLTGHDSTELAEVRRASESRLAPALSLPLPPPPFLPAIERNASSESPKATLLKRIFGGLQGGCTRPPCICAFAVAEFSVLAPMHLRI